MGNESNCCLSSIHVAPASPNPGIGWKEMRMCVREVDSVPAEVMYHMQPNAM